MHPRLARPHHHDAASHQGKYANTPPQTTFPNRSLTRRISPFQLENGDLILCREVISETLFARLPRSMVTQEQSSATGGKTTVKRCLSPINKPSKRKVEQIEVDDIYDSIKRLYGDDIPVTCSSQAVQPPVHSPGFLQVPAT